MYKFPEGLYTDVRTEKSFTTRISFQKLTQEAEKIRSNTGAFIRVFDGSRWYYSSTTNLEDIQGQIDTLAAMATPNPDILYHPTVQAFEVNKGDAPSPFTPSLTDIPVLTKKQLLADYLGLLKDPAIVHHTSYYADYKTTKSFYSSKGAALSFTWELCGIRLTLELACGENKDRVVISKAAPNFSDMESQEGYFSEEIAKYIAFTRDARPVVPGEYTVLLGPEAAGVFTHESFGHKSESDFMVGDAAMKAEWALGKTIGKELLTIVDDGNIPGSGYTPYDDEGTKAKKTEIIARGILTGRLHSAATSADLGEPLTGNARAINFEFEPIVRMTTTYIGPGDRPLADILAEIKQGVFVDTIKHGSGMSTFTIAPARAYMIENGQITFPIKVAVVTGSVFQALAEIDALSSEFELLSDIGGGCGKMEQWPLPVGYGGPYTRVKKLKVQ